MIKLGGVRYLPRPSGMELDEYRAYKERAEYFNATGRTLEGLHGLMFMKPAITTVPDNMSQYLENVDGEGTDVNQFMNNCTWDVLQTAFGGILVDAPEGAEVSVREAEINGLYPYFTYYEAEKIINWRFENVNRRKTLKLVVLQETANIPTADPFVVDERIRYRVLAIDKDGFYVERVYNEHEQIISEIYPKKFGEPMKHIPFYFLPTKQPFIPMMKNLADINIAWYRKSADLENGAHWTGVPTPYVLGFSPEVRTEIKDDGTVIEVPVQPLKLGGSKVIYFPQGTTDFKYLEFTGSGLQQLVTMMTSDEERMAILGARIISAEKKGVEAAETAKIHRAGENSVLATFANEMSAVFSAALKEYLEWTVNQELDDINVQINTDYDVSEMSPAELTALVSLWQTGGIAKSDLFRKLKEGEILDNLRSFDDMQAEIEEAGNTNQGQADDNI